MNGTHFPKTKKQLSKIERDLLDGMLHLGGMMKTAKEVSRMMNWDIRQTTATLSNIVGMDLCIETDSNTKLTNPDTHQFSSGEPLYGIPLNTIIQKRAVYAYDRKGDGITLWHLIKGLPEYGEHLWPHRPIDRVNTKGHIKRDGDKVIVTMTITDEVEALVGQDVDIILKSK